MQKHLETIKRSHIMVNLDPAAEQLYYEPTVNIRDLISLDEAMEEAELGPNGGLMFCMEYLLENIEWLEDEISPDTVSHDEYIIIDCPGQIELFTHSDIMKRLINVLQSRLSLRVCCVYLLESQFMSDYSKFFSGVLTAISAMVQLEVPHINVLSKMDMIEGRPGDLKERPKDDDKIPLTFDEEEEEMLEKRRQESGLDYYIHPAPRVLLENALADYRTPTGDRNSVGARKAEKWRRLNEAMVHLLEEFDMVSFIPLNIYDQDSVEYTISCVDNSIQYGEDEEPKEPKFDEGDYEDFE